ncbi:MAG: MarR family transcriptional regulator [Atopobiaceae bacterium]|nr:MarR family transcriptional regulator [Atopobiaceae bacterium]
MRQDQDFVRPDEWSTEQKVLFDLGFFGRYLHYAAGGRSGQKRIITYLACHDGHMTQRELQETLDIKSGSLSEVLAKVEADGLIERTRSQEDRRLQEVRLTARGREQAKAYVEDRERFEAASLACLTDDERGQLLSLLDRVTDHWKSIAQSACASPSNEGVCA